jgi:hypothetical protein
VGLGGGAKVAQLALAGGGGEEAEGHGVSLACGESASQQVSKPAGRRWRAPDWRTFDNGTPDWIRFFRLESYFI